MIWLLIMKVFMLCLFLQTQPSDTKMAKSVSDVTAVNSLESKWFHFVDTFKEEKGLRLCCDTFTPHPWAASVQWSPSTGKGWPRVLVQQAGLWQDPQWLLGKPSCWHLCRSLQCWFWEVEKQGEGNQHQHLWARKARRMNVTPLCSLCVN